MSDLRKQAREAVRNVDHKKHGLSFWETKVQCANAASDVWEPRVAELEEALQNLIDEVAPVAFTTGKGWPALRKAIKLMGGYEVQKTTPIESG